MSLIDFLNPGASPRRCLRRLLVTSVGPLGSGCRTYWGRFSFIKMARMLLASRVILLQDSVCLLAIVSSGRQRRSINTPPTSCRPWHAHHGRGLSTGFGTTGRWGASVPVHSVP